MKKITVKRNANPFTFNGGIGRVTFIISLVVLFLIYFTLIGGGIFLINILDLSADKDLSILKFYTIICSVIFFYTVILCYMKRLYDIISDKRKSVFYTISLYILLICLEFLPGNLTSILSKVIAATVIISFLLIPGKSNDV